MPESTQDPPRIWKPYYYLICPPVSFDKEMHLTNQKGTVGWTEQKWQAEKLCPARRPWMHFECLDPSTANSFWALDLGECPEALSCSFKHQNISRSQSTCTRTHHSHQGKKESIATIIDIWEKSNIISAEKQDIPGKILDLLCLNWICMIWELNQNWARPALKEAASELESDSESIWKHPG